jgi:hypothetical protein
MASLSFMRPLFQPGVDVFPDIDREDLLDDLMDALNALAAIGCPVTVEDGRLESRAGTLLPAAVPWSRPRPLTLLPVPLI